MAGFARSRLACLVALACLAVVANAQTCADCDANNTQTCVDGSPAYCICNPGFVGPTCSTAASCPAGCENGDCVANNNCLCDPGWFGSSCALANCPRACIHGVCDEPGVCQCDVGFGGPQCGVAIDFCEGVNCSGKGLCQPLIGGFECICEPGFEGINCQNETNECEGVTCLNGGVCVDGFLEFECICADGFTGDLCQTDINECLISPPVCREAGCINLPGTFECVCPPGKEVDPTAIIMGSGGRPSATAAPTPAPSPTPSLPPVCVEIDDCVESLCSDNSTCVDGTQTYTCECDKGFEGQFCDQRIDHCIGNMCAAQATCINGLESYTCQCPNGTSGEFCERMGEVCSVELNSCYQVFADRVNWPAAYTACLDLDMNLATIKSLEEADFINSAVVGPNVDDSRLWIGGRRRTRRSKDFVWVDGSPVRRFQSWLPGEPNDLGGREDCIRIGSKLDDGTFDPDGRWVDQNCNKRKWGFICETVYQDLGDASTTTTSTTSTTTTTTSSTSTTAPRRRKHQG